MPEALQRVGVVAALHKPQAAECTARLVAALREREIEVLADLALESLGLGAVSCCAPERWGRESDLVIALGGDGTLLASARASAPHGVPLLGVDLGGFGFLAEQPFDRLLAALDDLVAGRFGVEERLMLSASARSPQAEREHFFGLNDAVIAKTVPLRLVHLDTWVDNEFVTQYAADGLIISTPTGSTAYNLSAGGALVDPRVDCLILTPICPHTLYSRPLVIPASARVCVRIGEETHVRSAISLTVDGQLTTELLPNEEVTIQAAPFRARLVRLDGHTFFGRLRHKLHWGRQR